MTPPPLQIVMCAQVRQLQAGVVFAAALMERASCLLGEDIPAALGRSAVSILKGGVAMGREKGVE